MKQTSEVAVFGGGCFWCTEAVFKRLRGVLDVTPGYTGGTTKNPTYDALHYRNTDHVEVVEFTYDPGKVSYQTLLDVFFGTHDPTTLNRQANDVGPEYRSVIFYANKKQKKLAESTIKQLETDHVFAQPIVTTVEPLTKFYPAEPEHKDFYERNQQNSYCQIVISPKIAKFRQKYANLLKEQVSW